MSTHESTSVSPFGCLATQTKTIGSLSPIDVYDLLGCGSRRSTERRWNLLHVLWDFAPIPKTDLISQLAAVEYECDPSEVTTAQRRRINSSLVNTHFPPFEDAGIIELASDSDGTQVSLGENAEELFEFVGFERGWFDRLTRLFE